MSKFHEGQRVVTNNLEWGTIEAIGGAGSDWHWIRLDDGSREMQNDERLTTRHPFGDIDPQRAELAANQERAAIERSAWSSTAGRDDAYMIGQ